MERRKLSAREHELALSLIEKGQQMAGHFPSACDLERVRRISNGETSVEEAKAELGALVGHIKDQPDDE